MGSLCNTGPGESLQVKEMGLRIEEEGSWVCFHRGTQQERHSQQRSPLVTHPWVGRSMGEGQDCGREPPPPGERAADSPTGKMQGQGGGSFSSATCSILLQFCLTRLAGGGGDRREDAQGQSKREGEGCLAVLP